MHHAPGTLRPDIHSAAMEADDRHLRDRIERENIPADTLISLIVALAILGGLTMLGVSALVGVFTGH
jgi:hypothetical protein